jgi:hypothetical protein
MHKNTTKFCSLLIFLFCALLAPTSYAGEQKEGISLEMMIDEVKLALLKVEKEAARRHAAGETKFPKLRDATLELNLVQSKKGGGKISFLIFTLGAENSSQITQGFKLVLTPPSADEKIQEVSAAKYKISDALYNAIISGADAVDHARRGRPTLHIKELNITHNFVIAKDGSGGLKVEFSGIGAELGGGATRKATQSIKLTYTN